MMSEIIISTDKEKLDLEMIYSFLKTAYWAKRRSKSMVQTTIDNSICFGVFNNEKQIGFARVVSDGIVFAYMMDVFILPEYQGNGYGKDLVKFILKNPQIKDVQNWLLATSDAHGLYEKFGFKPMQNPSRMLGKVMF